MALFGFNKAKVLASAEKYVQQGKLNNAIAEYEKIIEKDAKDLTVLNTIGDLYARVGQTEKAGEFYRKVGDSYASDGFTVKAIAMYKKLTKLNPSAISVVQRLAELYTQQGLYNDARQQYLVLADAYIKNNDVPNATRIFQKMLEMDPDNTSLQSKLADLYIKAGKKAEARDIYFRAATTLFDRGSVDQAEQSLDRVLSIDPTNVDALLMRGKIALNAGNGAAAVTFLEKIPDLDSRPDGLQAILRSYIISNDAVHAEGTARKLATVHNDLSGVRAYADFLLAAGNSEAVLKIYDEFVDRLVVGDTGEMTFALQGLSGQLKESPESLEKLRAIFQKAGATANIPEVNELLAHSYVKVGKLSQARDLYKELADLEPSNPQHMQNYRQVMARMGEDPAARPLAEGEAAQALFEEEIVDSPVPAGPEYPVALMEKISNVLTDAELFESYNKPQQAIVPLEAILEKAPKDARINQRLASVYSKVGRLGDAASRCDVLHELYVRADMAAEAKKYAEMATRFREQAGLPQPEAISHVKKFPVAADPVTNEVIAPGAQDTAVPSLNLPPVMSAAAAPATPTEMGEAHEIDLSAEWESAIADVPATDQSQTSEFEVTAQPVAEQAHPSVVSDLLEEISFYLSQRMFDEARSAIVRCESMAPANVQLADLKQQLEAVLSGSAPVSQQPAVDLQEIAVQAPATSVEEATVMEYDFNAAISAPVESVADGAASFPVLAPEAPEAEEVAVTESSQTAVVASDETREHFEVAVPEATVEEISFEVPAQEEVETEAPVVEVSQLEVAPGGPSTGVQEPTTEKIIRVEETTPPVVEEPAPVADLSSKPVEEAVPEPEPQPEPEKDVLTDLVLDLESSLPEDFAAPAPQVISIPEPAPMVAAAAAATAPVITMPLAAEAVTASSVLPQMAASAAAPVAVEVAPASEENTMLSDLFEEFKEDVGEAVEEREDPDTHYNLGVAFKEMGLLDEAIGELQKVCKAIDNGSQFSQVMQAYTWLANCFVEKGVPEASVKWYEKALTIASNEESRTALHYDLANAFEAAGNRPEALRHFTEVYGTNIDYRDVAERIKALKS